MKDQIVFEDDTIYQDGLSYRVNFWDTSLGDEESDQMSISIPMDIIEREAKKRRCLDRTVRFIQNTIDGPEEVEHQEYIMFDEFQYDPIFQVEFRELVIQLAKERLGFTLAKENARLEKKIEDLHFQLGIQKTKFEVVNAVKEESERSLIDLKSKLSEITRDLETYKALAVTENKIVQLYPSRVNEENFVNTQYCKVREAK